MSETSYKIINNKNNNQNNSNEEIFYDIPDDGSDYPSSISSPDFNQNNQNKTPSNSSFGYKQNIEKTNKFDSCNEILSLCQPRVYHVKMHNQKNIIWAFFINQVTNVDYYLNLEFTSKSDNNFLK
ncbi:hypothetical protein H8356DRAFT_1423299 [Neocallimastix lanati (nom. inval.)]|nr:hypothetical protein H8356DRAFT_1423299 [Neocallimastix sp. JGI-2020a]